MQNYTISQSIRGASRPPAAGMHVAAQEEIVDEIHDVTRGGGGFEDRGVMVKYVVV